MLRRLAPGVLTLTLLLTLPLAACSGKSRSATGPAAPEHLLPQSTLDTISGSAALGEFELIASAEGVSLTPAPVRTLAAQGDSYDADITDFFLQFPCGDCLKIEAFGLTPDFDLWVDISLRHPYKPSTLPGGRADLGVYDTRVILIPELDLLATPLQKFTFPDSPTVKDGSPAGIMAMGVWDLVRNADGYTHHYDIVTRNGVKFDGTLNPFRWYFNEDDPSGDFEGAQIPHHRFRPGDGPDTKRWLIDVTDPDQPSSVTRKFIAIIEASWGQGTTKANRTNNLERVPEYNMKEAYSVETTLPQTLFADTPQNELITFDVEVLDWQAGAITGTGDDQVNCPSDVLAVSVDLPGLPGSPGNERIFPFASQTIPASGTGQPGDPYIFTFTLPTQPGPDLSALVRDDPYLALIRVEDEYMDHSLVTQCQSGPADADNKIRGNFIGGRLHNKEPLTKTIQDFVAYRIIPVFVRPAGPPTITLNTPLVDQQDGLVRLSGTVLGLDSSTLGLAPNPARNVVTITQVGPPPAPMNTPWTLPLQPDLYGRFSIVMPLLPGGANQFTVTANNQYSGGIPGATSNANYPPITWNVDPTTQPSFRISMAWSPTLYEKRDVSDLDLHMWSPDAPAATTFRHLFYCNATGGNSPGTLAKPCSTSQSVVDVRYILRDDNGFGPEVMDGINNFSGTSLQINSSYPVGVNYFTNRKNSAAWPMNISIRVATFVGVPSLQILTNPAVPGRNRENFNTPLEFYAGQGLVGDYERSWWRPCDILVDVGGNVSIGAASVIEANLGY